MIRAKLASRGVEYDPERFGVFYDNNRSLKIKRECDRVKSNGNRIGEIQVQINCSSDSNHPLPLESVKEIERQIDRHVRRYLRMRELDKDQSETAWWSYSSHRFLVALFQEAKLPLKYAAQQPRSLSYEYFKYQAAQVGIEYTAPHIEDGRVDFEALHWGDISYIGSGRPCLRLKAQIPATILASLPGKRMQDVIDHPVIRRSKPVKIVEAVQDSEMLTLVMEDVQQPLQRAPTGISQAWVNIPFWPRTTDT